MLSDVNIKDYLNRGDIQITCDSDELITAKIDDFAPEKQIQPGSIDLRLRPKYRKFNWKTDENLTFHGIKDNSYTELLELRRDEKLTIQPREIILATTLETITLSKDFAGFITGRSSIARLGVMVQCCQDFVNPGHRSAIALQLVNLSPYCIEIDISVPICQFILFKLDTAASQSYPEKADAKYTDEKTVKPSGIYTESGNDDTKPTPSKLKKIKSFFKKYIDPFLPPAIGVLLFTPLAYSDVAGMRLSEVLYQYFWQASISTIALLIFIFLYCWLRGDDKS